jgi:hypothetical protein
MSALLAQLAKPIGLHTRPGISPKNGQLTHVFGSSGEIPVIPCFSLFRLQETLFVSLRKGSPVGVSLETRS